MYYNIVAPEEVIICVSARSGPMGPRRKATATPAVAPTRAPLTVCTLKSSEATAASSEGVKRATTVRIVVAGNTRPVS